MKQCTVLNIHQPYSHFLLCEFVFEKPTLASPSTTSLLWWIWKNNIALASTLASCSARKGHMNRDDKSICYIVTWNDGASLWKLLLFLTRVCFQNHTPTQTGNLQVTSSVLHADLGWCTHDARSRITTGRRAVKTFKYVALEEAAGYISHTQLTADDLQRIRGRTISSFHFQVTLFKLFLS